MGYKWVTVTGDGGKTSFKISQGSGHVYVYDGAGRSIGETRSVEDAISLIRSAYGKKVWTIDIGEETSSCFSADTQILTPAGYQQISKFRRGDHVLSVRLPDFQPEIGIVSLRKMHPIARILEVRTELSTSPICTTSTHLFLTSRGWTLSRNLHVGDKLIHVGVSNNSTAIVTSVNKTNRFEPVYNLITTGAHNYIVGGVPVHNFAHARTVRTLWHQIFIDPWLICRPGLLKQLRFLS